jgi:glycosyltransferase involved in cell wall biosynthesis
MDKYQVAIVIPAFNEEATIFNVVRSVVKYGVVIVVNDASTDKTGQLAEEAGAIVINHKINKGYDGAINSGFIRANQLNFDAVITFDADGQHNVESLKVYINKLCNDVDLILGKRPNSARISEWLFKVYTVYRYKVEDPLCGMKGYSMKLYKDLGYFDSCESIGTELAIYSILNNCSYVHVKIPIVNRGGNSRFGNIFSSNYRILKALLKIVKRYG